MRPTPARFRSERSQHLAVGFAFLLAAIDQRPVSAAPNELGHPVMRDFPPGKSVFGHQSPAVTQDAAGFIYIANDTNVRCYDGATWQGIKLPAESAGVRKFAVTADGTVYMGGASVLGFLRRAGETSKYVSLADRLPPTASGCDDIFDVLAVGNTVYFADEEKILIWRDQRFSVVPCRTPPHSRGARLHRIGDTVYVTALDRALCRLAQDRLEVVADDPVLRQNQIISVEPGPAGALALLTAERGFFQLATGRVVPLPTEANRWLAGKCISRAQRLADGSLVVAFTSVTGDGGMRFGSDGRYLGPLDNSIGLYVKTLRDFFCDREGGLWLGTETGVIRLEWPSALTVFDGVNGLGLGAVADVARHEGALYAATDEGVYRLAASDDHDGRCAHFERIFSQPVYSLASHRGGLLATGYTGLFVQSPAGFTIVTNLPPGGGILHRSSRDLDHVWLGTTRGLQSLRHTPAGWRDEGLVPGFDENCRGLSEAPDGSLWVSTAGRDLFLIEDAGGKNAAPAVPRIARFSGGRGLPEYFQRANTADWAGAPIIVVNTAPRPFRFEAASRRFVPLAGTESLLADASEDGWFPSDDDIDRSDALWLAGPTSIYRVPRQGPPSRLPQLVKETVGHVSQMREEKGGDGTVLWICGAKGVVRLEVARAFPVSLPLATLLTPAGVREGDRLRPGHAPLNFRYVALRHQIANAVTYQTRLAGYDRDWSPWSANRDRPLANLPAGSYRFEVQARDADGQISAPASLAFTVLPPWWLTAWALLGYAAAGTGLVAGVVRLRTRALHRRARQLEVVIAERTSELAKKNLELIRLNRLELDEKISARLAEEKAHLEVLRYQLNPHFLFNALTTISGLTLRAPAAARSVTRQLAEFCRLTLTRGRHEFVTLDEEFQMLARYLEVVRSGRDEPPEIALTLDPSAAAARIPAFLLLPLVENSSKYGRGTEGGPLRIEISARRDPGDGTLAIEVANTGTWVDDFADHGDAPSTQIGLDNIRQRLARMFPGTHTFTIEASDGWVRVRIRLSAPP